MAAMTFLNFDLVIRLKAGDQYCAEADIPGWKPARVDFEQPFSDEEVGSFREVLGGPARDVEVPAGQPRGSPAEYRDNVMRFGRRLYETVFVDDLREGLSRRLTEARNQGLGLRIRLTLDQAPKLAELPWEYLCAGGQLQGHLALDKRTPIVRFLPLGGAPPAALVTPPLNILVMLASPSGYPQLQVNDEWNRIKTALEPLVQTKEVTVDRLPNFKHPKATQAALLDQLNLAGKKYHVFHFIGHGGFDKQNRPGLAMEGGSDGTGEIVPTKQLAVLVDHFSLRLAILNACEGAKSSPWDAYSGVAQSLVQLGIPAVIAMQFKITDATAILFAGQFYKALATGMTVEDSLNFARKAIWVADNPTEWGTPVLFSQSEDGVLFNIDRPTEEQQREAKIKALVNEAKVAIERQAWDQAIKRLQEIVAEQQSAGGSG